MSTTAPTFTQSTILVARREVTMRLRSKSFLISTGILLLSVLASIVIGSLASANQTPDKIAVERSVSNDVSTLSDTYDITVVDSREQAEALVEDGTVSGAVVSGSEGSELGITVIGDDSPPLGLIDATSVAPDVVLLDPADQSSVIVYFVALAFGLVFFMSALTFGSTIAQSVVEEKQTRVVEILIAAIPVRALLAGKVLGNSILAFGQIAIIAVLAAGGLLFTGQIALLGALGPSIIWFVVFFVFGFVLLAALFAASASLVSRQEDMATVTTPVTMLVMIPYFMVIFFNDNPFVLGIMSYVPFAAPVGMPMRVFLGSAEWWEPLLSLAILVVTTAGVIVLGSRIYGNSLLRTGPRVKLAEALQR